MSGRCVVGVDLGGTNVRAQAFFPDGREAGERVDNPSFAQEGTERIIEAVAKTIHAATATSVEPPVAVGLAIPGHVDDRAGVVRWTPNFGERVNGIFESWRNVPIREPLSRYVGLPMSMGNDANLAALGEYMFGSGRGSTEDPARCLVMFTLGTGIGGGVVMAPHAVQGRASGPLLLVGGNHGGGELGHTIVNHGGATCNAGSYGAIEAYCGRDAIIERAVHRIQRGRASRLKDLVEGDLSRITPRLISEAAARGDEVSLEVYREVGEWLGVGIGNMISIFAPDIVAVGGQIAKAGDFILGPARDAARNVAVESLFRDCRIVPAVQLEDAGILGAAALAHQSLPPVG